MNKVIVSVIFLVMIFINAIANIIPLNGYTTGEVSNLYANLFAPASITFAIWGLIYILLAVYVLYQLFRKYDNKLKEDLYNKIGFYFSLSCIANSAWIFFWHYLKIGFSLIFMFMILICLIIIIRIIDKSKINLKQKTFLKIPFSVYFGWITVASIANVTAFLVSIGWESFGTLSIFITVIILFVGVLISSLVIFKNKDIIYGIVIIWAYAGIFIKHISSNGFNLDYPVILAATIISIVLLIICEIYVIIHKAD